MAQTAEDKITQEDAASYLESDAYAKLPQQKKDQVIQFLKKNMVRQTMGTPDVAGDVQARREQTRGTGFAVEGIEEAQPKSIPGRIIKGGVRGLTGIAGLPMAVEEAATTPPTEYEKGRHLRHPFVFAEPQKGVGLTLDRLFFDPQFREASKAKQAFKEGKTSEAIGHGGAAILPGVGPYAAGIGEQVGKGEWAEALGEQGVYALTGLLTKKALPSGVKPFQRLSAAAGGGTKEFEATMGDLARTAKETGFRKIKNPMVSDLRELVKKTGMDSETFFNQAVQPFNGDQIMPTDVARDLLKEANKFDIHTPEGRAARLYLRQRAIDYQHPWTFGDLNQKRMKMFDSVLEGKTDVKQMGAVRSNVEKLADKTIENSLRDTVYDYAASKYKGKIDFRALKEKQARLLDLNDRLEKRVQQIADQESEYKAAGPLKKAGLYIRGHMTGVTPAMHPKLSGSPEKAASKQIKKAFSRLRNPISSRPSPKRSLPPLEPEAPPSPKTPPRSSPSATAGHPVADSDIAGYRKNIEKEWGNYPASFTGEGLRRSGKIPENVSLRDLEKKGFIKQNEEGLWDIVKHPESDIEEIRRRGPGVNPEDAAARERQAEFLRTKRENLAGQKKEVPQKAADIRKEQERPVSPKPESEIAKAANENSPEQARYYQEQAAKRLFNKPYGELNESEKIKTLSEGAKLQDAARKAKQSYTEFKGKGVTVKGKPGTVIGTSFGSLTVKLSNGDIIRVTPDEVKPGLSPLK